MLTTTQVMDTLFRANNSLTEKFSDALMNAADDKSETLDCVALDKAFSFALALTYCKSCEKPHWFVAIANLHEPFEHAMPATNFLEVKPMKDFEAAVESYLLVAGHSDETKH